MGALDQSIEMAMRKHADKRQIKQVLVGVAKDVTDTTCTVERDGAPTLNDVRLNAIDDNLETYLTVYPAEGSNVIVAIIENLVTEAVVIRCSEVAKIGLKIGTITLVIDKDGIVMNGGELGGLIKIEELKTQLEKVTDRIDAVITAIKTATVTPGDGGAAYKLAMTAQLSALSKENFDKIEDTKIKH
jgi:hypothetical protein